MSPIEYIVMTLVVAVSLLQVSGSRRFTRYWDGGSEISRITGDVATTSTVPPSSSLVMGDSGAIQVSPSLNTPKSNMSSVASGVSPTDSGSGHQTGPALTNQASSTAATVGQSISVVPTGASPLDGSPMVYTIAPNANKSTSVDSPSPSSSSKGSTTISLSSFSPNSSHGSNPSSPSQPGIVFSQRSHNISTPQISSSSSEDVSKASSLSAFDNTRTPLPSYNTSSAPSDSSSANLAVTSFSLKSQQLSSSSLFIPVGETSNSETSEGSFTSILATPEPSSTMVGPIQTVTPNTTITSSAIPHRSGTFSVAVSKSTTSSEVEVDGSSLTSSTSLIGIAGSSSSSILPVESSSSSLLFSSSSSSSSWTGSSLSVSQRPTIPPSGIRYVSMEITINQEFREEYNDEKSEEYKGLEKRLIEGLENTFSGLAGFAGVRIIFIKKGSIVCSYLVILAKDSEVGNDKLKDVLQKASDEGKFGFKVTSVTVDDGDVKEVEEKLPEWALITMIVLGSLAFLLVVAVMVLCVKYRRYHGGDDNPSYYLSAGEVGQTCDTVPMSNYKMRANEVKKTGENTVISHTNPTYGANGIAAD